MKTAILALSVSLLAASAAVHADPTSGIPNLTDIAIDGGGNVIHMDQIDAAQYCQNLGDRLPTIRELALWATQYGAKISDTPQNGFPQNGFDEEIQATDAAGNTDTAGNPDTFYYQHSGYKAPAGELGQYSYWSSSVVPGHSNHLFVLFDDGFIAYVSRSDNGFYLPVRCVQSR